MRRIGLDIGAKRIGVAVSDPAGQVASPHAVWDAREVVADASVLKRMIEDYEAEEIVVGLPLSMDGTEGQQAARTREIARRLAERVDVPVVFFDERLSSAEAERVMAAAGLDSRQRRGRVDKVAATIVLQSYLDAQRSESGRARDEGAHRSE